MADFGGSELDGFRAEAREWLEANFPKSLAFQQGAMKLSQTVSGDFSIALANAARARQGVKVNQKLVQAVVGGGS